ncbi:Rossmann fold nucleotide-binding protein Smf possibly involved in DNA uptake [Georgfuchsia toluolica]|uniref:Rossmann fold nucleotide-binding protein Smf possibly involved in DNA uptake n=1 Tax=Georgfuchsia toluolica TaxID=424218 RepID=A0A916J5T9_9PROT|nr:DNA-processing protein DprA [Georgfuchsia toluolica]CAG4883993.1 Rossmann fold nucleotide-binding protein Smf possibly involved in DNA uptake [Georgfuchsia toluolica]
MATDARLNAAELAGWLRLTAVPGIGGESQRKLLKAFGLPPAIFSASVSELATVVGYELAQQLLHHDASADIEAGLAWANQSGNRIVTLADAAYPRALLDQPDPPVLLYAKGRIELLNCSALAIVGSRNATRQGEANAEAFAEALAAAGITIVSGLALGIDAAAHRGALKSVASTIAVIGTGPDRIYPARNQDLARLLAERGLIISEFPVGTPPLANNFPRRNRIIAGLGLGCLVVEAAQRSGSLITARLAADAGREVFAIPGSIHSPLSRGCHALIRQGAKLVESAQDILEELRWETELSSSNSIDSTDNPGEPVLLGLLGHDPCTVDVLIERSGLTADNILAMLMALELDGRVAQLPGGLYQRLT